VSGVAADASLDINVPPRGEVAMWNETRWCGCWNPRAGVGLYLHLGRFRQDLDMWWAQVVAYLPDGRLCAERVWGRSRHPAGAELAGLSLAMTEDGWTGSFDGVGELATVAQLARAPRGSSAPSRAMRWQVDAHAATPLWDIYAGRDGQRLQVAGDSHIQQGFETSGWLEVGDERHALDGIGFKDHSSGVREFGPWTGHTFLMIVGPEWTAHLLAVGPCDHGGSSPVGALLHRDGTRASITELQFPSLTGATGEPLTGELRFATDAGEQFAFTSELVHALPMTITDDNDNINGIDWELAADPIVLIEGFGRLVAPDGEVLHCFHERSLRRDQLSRPPAPSAARPRP
jgi:hypothetical protein